MPCDFQPQIGPVTMIIFGQARRKSRRVRLWRRRSLGLLSARDEMAEEAAAQSSDRMQKWAAAKRKPTRRRVDLSQASFINKGARQAAAGAGAVRGADSTTWKERQHKPLSSRRVPNGCNRKTGPGLRPIHQPIQLLQNHKYITC